MKSKTPEYFMLCARLMPTVACGGTRSSIGCSGRRHPHHTRMQEAWFTATSPEPDPFATLGVARSASRPEIKRAYRLRALELHPDVCDHPSSSERFQALVDAYQTVQTFAPGSSQTRSHTVGPLSPLSPSHRLFRG